MLDLLLTLRLPRSVCFQLRRSSIFTCCSLRAILFRWIATFSTRKPTRWAFWLITHRTDSVPQVAADAQGSEMRSAATQLWATDSPKQIARWRSAHRWRDCSLSSTPSCEVADGEADPPVWSLFCIAESLLTASLLSLPFVPMSCSSSSSSSSASSASLYSPFQRLMMQVVFQAQTDANYCANGQRPAHDVWIDRLLRFAAFPAVPAALALEILDLTAASLPRSSLLPLVLDPFLIPDCVGIVLEYVVSESPNEGFVPGHCCAPTISWVAHEKPQHTENVPDSRRPTNRIGELQTLRFNRVQHRLDRINQFKLECILNTLQRQEKDMDARRARAD